MIIIFKVSTLLYMFTDINIKCFIKINLYVFMRPKLTKFVKIGHLIISFQKILNNEGRTSIANIFTFLLFMHILPLFIIHYFNTVKQNTNNN